MIKISKLLSSLKFQRVNRASHDAGFPTISGQHYLATLSEIVEAKNAKWYLEIGSRSGRSLSKIGCNYIAIDPEFEISNPVFREAEEMHFFQMTSDEFFSRNCLRRIEAKPDIAFIDGMHHFEFALRDFLNCEAAMDPKGIIMLHDVCPSTKAMASRDLGELAARRPWTGDVWKTVVALLDHRPDLEIHLLDAEKTGLCVVHNLKPENTLLSDNYEKIVSEYINLDFNTVSPRFLYDRLPLEPAAGIAHRLPKSLKNT